MARSPFAWITISPLWSGAAALTLVVVGVVLFDRIFPRVPGNEFAFQAGFAGPYCVVVSPAYPEAEQNSDGYLVYRFNAQGISRSSTFPRGAGSLSKAVVAGAASPPIRQLQNWSCGSWSFGDTTLVMGTVVQPECRRIANFNATLAGAMQSQCGVAP
jgi:hypothetical protein